MAAWSLARPRTRLERPPNRPHLPGAWWWPGRQVRNWRRPRSSSHVTRTRTPFPRSSVTHRDSDALGDLTVPRPIPPRCLTRASWAHERDGRARVRSKSFDEVGERNRGSLTQRLVVPEVADVHVPRQWCVGLRNGVTRAPFVIAPGIDRILSGVVGLRRCCQTQGGGDADAGCQCSCCNSATATIVDHRDFPSLSCAGPRVGVVPIQWLSVQEGLCQRWRYVPSVELPIRLLKGRY